MCGNYWVSSLQLISQSFFLLTEHSLQPFIHAARWAATWWFHLLGRYSVDCIGKADSRRRELSPLATVHRLLLNNSSRDARYDIVPFWPTTGVFITGYTSPNLGKTGLSSSEKLSLVSQSEPLVLWAQYQHCRALRSPGTQALYTVKGRVNLDRKCGFWHITRHNAMQRLIWYEPRDKE